MVFRASINTGLPILPNDKLDPNLHRELVKLYTAFQNLQIGIDKINRSIGYYDVAINYGQLVNIYNAGGSHVRLASAAAGTVYPALGFCPIPENVGINTDDEVQFTGLIPGLSGLTPGAIYYLSDTVPGNIVSVKPVGAGKIVQPIGFAVSSDTLFFNPTLLYTAL